MGAQQTVMQTMVPLQLVIHVEQNRHLDSKLIFWITNP